jgi:ABC-type lipoprotein export system ATPase subunit
VDCFDEDKSKEKRLKAKKLKANKSKSTNYENAELEDISRLSLILDELGISELSGEYPSVLSGGELRRLCIARTLYAEPKIILADEPTNDLDKDNRDKLRTIFRGIADKGVAVVVVTHDAELAEEADERIRL